MDILVGEPLDGKACLLTVLAVPYLSLSLSPSLSLSFSLICSLFLLVVYLRCFFNMQLSDSSCLSCCCGVYPLCQRSCALALICHLALARALPRSADPKAHPHALQPWDAWLEIGEISKWSRPCLQQLLIEAPSAGRSIFRNPPAP